MKKLHQILLLNRIKEPLAWHNKLFLFLYRCAYATDPRMGILESTWFFYLGILCFPVTLFFSLYEFTTDSRFIGAMLNPALVLTITLISLPFGLWSIFTGRDMHLFNPFANTKKNRTHYVFYFALLFIGLIIIPLIIGMLPYL